MASEHTLTLKAQLDTSDVQQKINGLNQQQAASPIARAASKDIDSLTDSMKNLRRAIGGGVLIKSLGDAAKATQAFGEKTEQTVNKLTSSMNTMIGAIATGNVAIMAFVAAMELLAVTSENSTQRLSKEALEERRKHKFEAAVDERSMRERQDIIDQTVRSGNETALTSQLQDAYARRASYVKQSEDATTPEGIRAAEVKIRQVDTEIAKFESALKKAVQKTLDVQVEAQNRGNLQAMRDVLASGKFTYGNRQFDTEVIEQVQESLKKLDSALKESADQAWKAAKEAQEAEEERIRSLREAQEDWKVEEKDRAAIKSGDLDYFKKAMKEAEYAMQHVQTAEDFNTAKSRYVNARSQFESIEEDRRRKAEQDEKNKLKSVPTAADYATALQSLTGTAPSSFNAAGFSMGESLNPTAEVERQLDEVIRLMQEQLRKELTQTMI